MCGLDELFANNRAWAARRVADDPAFFTRLAGQQSPRYMWIGCSDSRVPANEIIGLQPGEVFVHRNIANLVVHSDLNCLSVLQYAVEVLKVENIMVVGHYGCGGVQAVAERRSAGLADNWLRHIEDIAHKHAAWLDAASSDEDRGARLAELNVIEQVANVCRTTILRRAWYRGSRIEVHGLIYGLRDGLLRQLGPSVNDGQSWRQRYDAALQALQHRRSG
ncbi:carbonate dehydratase [Methylobacterium nodulans]|uniref:Carbonic anhydrase n=1 Tax=Methylobacterium nodulans (strain LMG 21967 / CNCM I-2342 / ORS 2060) TaxID=460265 RepID=B8IRP3_METNO|nr:carbonate dehydratase [Methylobacterium nodulans]ACL60593.1 carbonic anhydrase [Methylobacterium nodulans ORS 2060]